MGVEDRRGSITGYMRWAGIRASYAASIAREPGEALEYLKGALSRHGLTELSPPERPYSELARIYAEARRPDLARVMLSDYERTVPASLRRADEAKLHAARGFTALAEGDFDEAIAQFRSADHGNCRICVLPGLAQAYDQAGQADSARVIYERYLATPWLYRLNIDATSLAGAYFRLGELYEDRGDPEKASEYYSRFASLWKNADARLQPRVAEARRRLRHLAAEPRQ
jgi:tetratricopeptide (TPR) repeat protein